MALARSSTEADKTESAPPSHWRWAMLAGVWLLYFSFGLTVASLAPIVYLVEKDLGLDHASMGTILGAWPLIYIASSAPCGALLDKYGPKRMLFIAILLISTSGALRGISENYIELFLSVVILDKGSLAISLLPVEGRSGLTRSPRYRRARTIVSSAELSLLR